jgi:hypothetical protein
VNAFALPPNGFDDPKSVGVGVAPKDAVGADPNDEKAVGAGVALNVGGAPDPNANVVGAVAVGALNEGGSEAPKPNEGALP